MGQTKMQTTNRTESVWGEKKGKGKECMKISSVFDPTRKLKIAIMSIPVS